MVLSRGAFLRSRCLSRLLLGLIALNALPSPGSAQSVDPNEAINIRVYEAAHASVVNITTIVVDYDIFFTPYASEASGSGIVMDKAGHILTNHHVVADTSRLEVTLWDGSKWPATRVGDDAATDLAVIRIQAPPERLSPIRLGASAGLKVGQKVLAIGNPFGLEQTLTTGIVSSIRRYLKIGDVEMENVIQTDAAINPGNSGGPLLDADGRMVGINTAIFSPSGGNVGIGFAVPVDTAKWVFEELIAGGYVAYPWLGAELQTLIPPYARALKLPVEEGVLVGQIVRRGPSDRAGLRGGTSAVIVGNTRLIIGGDIIVAADGQPVRSSDDLTRLLRMKKPNEPMTLTVLRGGKELRIAVTLGERPRG